MAFANGQKVVKYYKYFRLLDKKVYDQFNDAKYSAIRERSVGLGVLGFHSYLQKK